MQVLEDVINQNKKILKSGFLSLTKISHNVNSAIGRYRLFENDFYGTFTVGRTKYNISFSYVKILSSYNILINKSSTNTTILNISFNNLDDFLNILDDKDKTIRCYLTLNNYKF